MIWKILSVTILMMGVFMPEGSEGARGYREGSTDIPLDCDSFPYGPHTGLHYDMCPHHYGSLEEGFREPYTRSLHGRPREGRVGRFHDIQARGLISDLLNFQFDFNLKGILSRFLPDIQFRLKADVYFKALFDAAAKLRAQARADAELLIKTAAAAKVQAELLLAELRDKLKRASGAIKVKIQADIAAAIKARDAAIKSLLNWSVKLNVGVKVDKIGCDSTGCPA